MNIFKRLAEKPWLAQSGTVVDLRTASYAASNQKVALVVFLAIVGVLFFLFFAAYHMRLEPLEFGGQQTDWVPMPEPPLLWFNTIVLGLASVAYEWARRACNRGQTGTAKLAFLVAGGITLAFLALQLVVWNQLIRAGLLRLCQPGQLVLLPHHRRPRCPPAWRFGGLGTRGAAFRGQRRRRRGSHRRQHPVAAQR